ncbi:hypothetical protein [Flavobacterium sp.]|nr:hypothetical protein [Flavobacterium sp.]
MITSIKDKSCLAPIVTSCRAAWKAGKGTTETARTFRSYFFFKSGRK